MAHGGTAWSETWTYFEGAWHEGNPAIVSARTHGLWLGSCVFDGARAFEGVTPDLEAHCGRVNASAEAFGLTPGHKAGEIMELAQDGVAKFDKGTALYIKPMYWAEQGGYYGVVPLAETTQFCISVFDTAMPDPGGSFSITKTSFRRPTLETAPVDAKAACLYPNSARALREVQALGFDNAVLLDAMGNVAELATANLFMVKDGVVHTPYPNGTFLNGITRQRVIKLLRDAGRNVVERIIPYRELQDADEIFSTGNYAKVVPITKIDDRDLQPGPVAALARELYWTFAHGG
ncbi:MAG: branched-chain amino acid aminotransferase [Pseudomonadota bacterium]